MGGEQRLQLGRSHLVAAHLDQLLEAVDDEHVALGIDRAACIICGPPQPELAPPAGADRDAFRVAVARLRRDALLARGWTVDAAADWVWMRSHLSGWQQLVGERGWAPERYVERTVRSILAELVVPAAS